MRAESRQPVKTMPEQLSVPKRGASGENWPSGETMSMQDPLYTSGKYFADPKRFEDDADFKAHSFLQLFLGSRLSTEMDIRSYIDVGCGSGGVVKRVEAGLRQAGRRLSTAKGYDVSSHVSNIKHDGIQFIHADFCASQDESDLVTLFDVLEHVPDTIEFLKATAERCSIIGLHIPLDNNMNAAMRDMFRAKLNNPGHLLFLDVASALNLLTLAGLRVVDYRYTFAFQAPSGRKTLLAKAVYPLRSFLAKFSPWLCGKTIGGTSLMVIALTPRGLRQDRSKQPA